MSFVFLWYFRYGWFNEHQCLSEKISFVLKSFRAQKSGRKWTNNKVRKNERERSRGRRREGQREIAAKYRVQGWSQGRENEVCGSRTKE